MSTDSINKQLASAQSHEEISEILHSGKSHERAPRRHEAADEPEPTVFQRTEIIGGKPFDFSAGSEIELERAITSAFKVASELQTPAPVAAAVDPNRAAAEAAERAELELRFKRGEITSQDYIEQSGAVKDYLEQQGVPLDEVRANLEETRHRNYEQSWADATTAFLNSGSDWPGGEQNKHILGLKLQELGLLDATDKVAAISAAWASMKKDGLIFEGASHGEPAEPSTATRRAAPRTTRQAAQPVQKIDTSSMTPVELLEQWKSAQPSAEEANKTFTTIFGGHT